VDFHGTEALLALPAFRVIHQVIGPRYLDLHLARKDRSIVCPRCEAEGFGMKESRTRRLRDLPILEYPVMLWLHVRRFQCPECPHRPWETRETFHEQVKWTERLSPRVREEFLRGCPCRARARRDGLSERTVVRWTFARSRGGRPRKLGRAIGLDAYARRKGHRSNTRIVDLDKGQPIATFQGRHADEVIAWFTSRPRDELARVEVGGLDMSKAYVAAIKEVCGEQGHVIARFHIIKQAVDALDEVLRSVQRPRDREAVKALKKLRQRWLKSADQLNVDACIARDEWRQRFPELRQTIDGGQALRKWFDRKDEKPAREALLTLIERARQHAQKPLQRLAGTLTRWFEPMVCSIRHRDTNGMTEGFNNKIELIQRMAYGLRNEHTRRKRILASCGLP
jgi:transposase